ncbi:hypothetical protein [Mesobacillus foraminis]|uniref:hypothetical protein n=1 Tax=Mesobacillus foraminis TaxID=279826 RepID=UPI001BE84A5A|nr:hypothetical protein [Mesobacillus foraminis]
MDRHIAKEAMAGAQSMAMDNFMSALKMKDPRVKEAHVKFALQEIEMTNELKELLKEMNADIIPLGSAEEQYKIVRHFEHFLEE